MDVIRIPAFRDNYLWLLRCEQTGTVAVVDPGDADAVQAELDRRGWGLQLILNTHHHMDHIGGNRALVARYGARVFGPQGEAGSIGGLDRGLVDGDEVQVGAMTAAVLEVPGHTLGHLAFHFAGAGVLFCGDTLFLMGCGRLFEGSPAQMWASLQRLRALPDETLVYCAHEYTLGNARFALGLLPGDGAIRARAAEVEARRAAGEPTVPDRLGREKVTNVFLRADEPAMALAVLGRAADPVEVFAELRGRKDRA